MANDQRASRRFQMRGTRSWIKLLTSQVALDWLRRYALGQPIGESVSPLNADDPAPFAEPPVILSPPERR